MIAVVLNDSPSMTMSPPLVGFEFRFHFLLERRVSVFPEPSIMIDETTKVASCFSNDPPSDRKEGHEDKMDPPPTGHPTGQIRILVAFFCGSPELSVMTDAPKLNYVLVISISDIPLQHVQVRLVLPSSAAAQPPSDRNYPVAWRVLPVLVSYCNWEPLNLVPVLAPYLQRA